MTVNSNATEGKNTLPISGTGFDLGFLASDLQKPSGEEFHLQIRAAPGKTIVIEASPDLKNWTEVARVQSILEKIDFSDAITDSNRAGYYRFYSE